METVSIAIQNLFVPCGCECKYCLLQSRKKADGVEYHRGKRIARKFADWAREKRISPLSCYIVGYCAEYPELYDNIAFNRDIGFAGADFSQCNGIRIRGKSETADFVKRLREAGVSTIDATFYGGSEYHDRFAARRGDFEFMLLLAETAAAQGIVCAPSIPVTEENRDMLGALYNRLSQAADPRNIHAFIPDYRGRGYTIENSRLRLENLPELPEEIRARLNLLRHKTECDRLASGLPEYTKRSIIINLRRDNIEALEQMDCGSILASAEKLDDDYYGTLPTITALADMYGDRSCTKLYRPRDLYWKWQKRYIAENNIRIYNVADERFIGSIRS